MDKAIFKKKLGKYTFATFNSPPQLDFCQVKQVHGVSIVQALTPEKIETADGLFAQEDFKFPLCIKTADCLPIAIIGSKGQALVHAGWRGLADGILNQVEIKKISPELFFIGPHIHFENYEVQADFQEHFPNSKAFRSVGEKITFSLGAEAIHLIKGTYPRAQIDALSPCTYTHPKLHSFRRDKSDLRNYNVLIKNP